MYLVMKSQILGIYAKNQLPYFVIVDGVIKGSKRENEGWQLLMIARKEAFITE